MTHKIIKYKIPYQNREKVSALPACSERLQLISASSALPAEAGAAAAKTGSDLAGPSAEPAAPAAEQVVSPVHAVGAGEPKDTNGTQ